MTTLLEMKQKKTMEYIAIMQAFCDGKTIEARKLSDNGLEPAWNVVKYPVWLFEELEYRVKEEA